MKSDNKIFLIIFLLVMVGVLVWWFFGIRSPQEESQDPTSQEPSSVQEGGQNAENIPAEEGYPNQVLDGKIVEIDLESETPTIKVNARIFKIVSDAGEIVKTVKISLDTNFISYNTETEEEGELKLEDLQVGDEISAAVNESTFDEVLTREVFTAFRITRFNSSTPQENL
jgi:hypothetical protein